MVAVAGSRRRSQCGRAGRRKPKRTGAPRSPASSSASSASSLGRIVVDRVERSAEDRVTAGVLVEGPRPSGADARIGTAADHLVARRRQGEPCFLAQQPLHPRPELVAHGVHRSGRPFDIDQPVDVGKPPDAAAVIALAARPVDDADRDVVDEEALVFAVEPVGKDQRRRHHFGLQLLEPIGVGVGGDRPLHVEKHRGMARRCRR